MATVASAASLSLTTTTRDSPASSSASASAGYGSSLKGSNLRLPRVQHGVMRSKKRMAVRGPSALFGGVYKSPFFFSFTQLLQLMFWLMWACLHSKQFWFLNLWDLRIPALQFSSQFSFETSQGYALEVVWRWCLA